MAAWLIVPLPIAVIALVLVVRIVWARRGDRTAEPWRAADYDERGLAIIDDVLRQQNPSSGPIGRTPMTWEQKRRQAQALDATPPSGTSEPPSSQSKPHGFGGGASGKW